MSVNHATDPLPDSEIIFDTISPTEKLIHRDGWMTLEEGELSKAVKSFGITRGRLALVASFIALCLIGAGFLAGIRFDQSRIDVINFSGRKFQMVGVAQMPGTDLLIPVYKDSEQLLRSVR